MVLIKHMNLFACSGLRAINLVLVRHSKWPYNYLMPLEYKEVLKLEDITKSDYKHMLYTPVRSSKPNEVYSLFYDADVDHFARIAMKRGQKAILRLLVDQTFATIKHTQLQKYHSCVNAEDADKIECNPLVIFHKAIENCMPLIVTRPIKRGGATYQVPYAITERVSRNLAMKWLINVVQQRPRPRTAHFPECMAKELIEAYYNEGIVVKKKLETHRQCEANKAYAHYRWG